MAIDVRNAGNVIQTNAIAPLISLFLTLSCKANTRHFFYNHCRALLKFDFTNTSYVYWKHTANRLKAQIKSQTFLRAFYLRSRPLLLPFKKRSPKRSTMAVSALGRCLISVDCSVPQGSEDLTILISSYQLKYREYATTLLCNWTRQNLCNLGHVPASRKSSTKSSMHDTTY